MTLSFSVGQARRIGVFFYASDDGKEYSRFYYDKEREELVYEGVHSGGETAFSEERAPFSLKEGETLELDLFVDGCVCEIFANDRQAISRKVYPSSYRVNNFGIYTEGSALLNDASVYDMAPTNFI